MSIDKIRWLSIWEIILRLELQGRKKGDASLAHVNSVVLGAEAHCIADLGLDQSWETRYRASVSRAHQSLTQAIIFLCVA